jgi:hypothetical protein
MSETSARSCIATFSEPRSGRVHSSRSQKRMRRKLGYEPKMFGERVREIQNASKHICKTLSSMYGKQGKFVAAVFFELKKGYDVFALYCG